MNSNFVNRQIQLVGKREMRIVEPREYTKRDLNARGYVTRERQLI